MASNNTQENISLTDYVQQAIDFLIERLPPNPDSEDVFKLFDAVVCRVLRIGMHRFYLRNLQKKCDYDTWRSTVRFAVFSAMVRHPSPQLKDPAMEIVTRRFLSEYTKDNTFKFDIDVSENNLEDTYHRERSNRLFRAILPCMVTKCDHVDETDLEELLKPARWSVFRALLNCGCCFLTFLHSNHKRLREIMSNCPVEFRCMLDSVSLVRATMHEQTRASIQELAIQYLAFMDVPVDDDVWLELLLHRNFDLDLQYPFKSHPSFGFDVFEMVVMNAGRVVASLLLPVMERKLFRLREDRSNHTFLLFKNMTQEEEVSIDADVQMLALINPDRILFTPAIGVLLNFGTAYALSVAEAFYGKLPLTKALLKLRDHHHPADAQFVSDVCRAYLLNATRKMKTMERKQKLKLVRELNARRSADRDESIRQRELKAKQIQEAEEEQERRVRALQENERWLREREAKQAEERRALEAKQAEERRVREEWERKMEPVRAMNRRRFFETKTALQLRDKAAAQEERAERARRTANAKAEAVRRAAQAKVDAANAKAKRQEEERQRQAQRQEKKEEKKEEKKPALRHSPPTQALLSAHLLSKRSAREDDVASVAESVATTAIPLPFPTYHYGGRKEERKELVARPDVDHEVKWSIKHGPVEPGKSPGTVVHRGREGGVDVVTTADSKVGITMWPALTSSYSSSVTSSEHSPLSSPSSASILFPPPPPLPPPPFPLPPLPLPPPPPPCSTVSVRTCLSCDQRASSDVCTSCFAMCACFVCAQTMRTCMVCGETGVRFRNVRLEW